MARVTGIGGVFFLAKSDHKELAAWYARHLGVSLEDWGGAIIKWTDDKRVDGGQTVWHTAAKDSEWFRPSHSSFMINYRVDDLDAMVAQLREGGIEIVKGPDVDFNGKFAWIMDPDGNKIELWEPIADDSDKK